MNVLETKSPLVRSLLQSIADMYGPDMFPMDSQQPDSPDHIVITSARDTHFSASIVSLRERPGRFSVMVELWDSPDRQLIPFQIAEDSEFGVAEIVEMLGKYCEWRRSESSDEPG